MTVGEYMSVEIIFANLKDGLHQTYTRMRERNIRHMPVIDDQDKLVGIISDRDLRRPDWLDSTPNLAQNYRLDNSILVKEAMSPAPTSLKADDDILKAIELFVDRRYGAVPVVDEQDKVIGIISAIDGLRAFRNRLTKEAA